VPTAALMVGTADLAPPINRYVRAAFAHPTTLHAWGTRRPTLQLISFMESIV
jgi:hypothetical protein